MIQDKHIIITAIICLSVLEVCAMFNGINGTMRTIIFAMIAGLTGLSLPQLKIVKNLKGGLVK